MQDVPFYFVLEKPSWFESFCVSISLLLSPFRKSVIYFYTCQDRCR